MISDFEIFDDLKYFENNRKTLKPDYLLCYYSTPHWSEIPRTVKIFIDKDFSYEIRIFWYKMYLKKRLFSSYKSNFLPDDIIKLLKKLNDLENVNFYDLYCSKKELYAPEGISEDTYLINHKSKTISINMCSHWTDENLFITEEEKLFLTLHKLLKDWKEKLYQDITRLHE